MDQFSSHPLYRKHDLDSVMSSLFSFYKKHFLTMFLTSFVVNIAVQFLTTTIDISKITSLTDPLEMLAEMKTWMWPMAGAFAGALLLTVILQYYIIYKPVDNSVNIFSSIYKSMKYLVPYIIIMILFLFFAVFAMIIGLFAIIIGIFFAALYVFMIGLFILPVLMVEGNNIGNAIGRTFKLSHRRFGPNLGWTAIITLIIVVGSLILSSLILLPFSGSFLKVLTNPEEATEAMSFMTNPWYIILSAATSSLFTPLSMILGAILYFNGRAREEDEQSHLEDNNEPPKVKVEDLYAKPYADGHPDNPENK
ncbi:MAG: hypothetical protein NT092_02635 [Bacteroidia bacterium]|nr:hypothetical protein [Bacteroidia bacterium]